MKKGLYANINAKRERIAEGSGERMRKPGSKGAPTAQAFKESAKTARMKEGGMADSYDSNRRDLLLRRNSINFVNKVPREGQTNLRNIPVGNNPTAPNYQKPESKAYMEDLRKRAPSILKKMIKEDLGTHRTPKLPKKTGGKVNKNCW